MTYQLTYENERGQQIEFNTDEVKILSFEGFGELDATIQSQQAPYQDGETYIGTQLSTRTPSLEVALTGTKEKVLELRRRMAQVFNPKINGMFRYEENDRVYVLNGIPEHVPEFEDNLSQTYQRVVIDLVCHNPFWMSPNIEEQPTFEGLFSFPFSGEFSMGTQRDNRIIDNDSDVESPLQIEFYGEAVNPRIDNLTTGEYLKVSQTLAENEVMKIDTTPGKKSVIFEDLDTNEQRNVFNWIDLESTFFQLAIGENEIEYTADNNIQGAEVNIYWRKRFVGV